MKDCLFCKIITNDIPSYTIYEDELCKVFLDINPESNGHLLLIPKTHYDNVLDVDSEFVTHAFNIIKKELYPLLKNKLNALGLTILENNDLGQDIKHFHIHLIPRYEKKDLDDLEVVFKKLSEK